MVYVVVCPSCGMARASYKTENIQCRYCGRVFTVEPVFSGGWSEARIKVLELNSKKKPEFKKLKLSRYKWRIVKKNMPVDVTVDMAKILYLLEEGPLTVKEISNMLSMNPRRVQKMLQNLRRMGLVECYYKPRKSLEYFYEDY